MFNRVGGKLAVESPGRANCNTLRSISTSGDSDSCNGSATEQADDDVSPVSSLTLVTCSCCLIRWRAMAPSSPSFNVVVIEAVSQSGPGAFRTETSRELGARLVEDRAGFLHNSG